MRLATRPEHNSFMRLICERDKHDLSELASCQSFVLENYTTDCPGYQGPIGVVIWGGDPKFLTTFEYNGAEWYIGVDTAQLLARLPQ